MPFNIGVVAKMDNKLYPVEVRLGENTRVYSPEFQTQEQHSAGWKRVLLLAHGKAGVRCCCPGSGEKRLSIHSRANSDRFHLARFPDTGPEHSEDCIYYGVDPAMSGLGGYKRGVVQELDDGSVKIKLKVGLQQRATSAPEDSQAAAKTTKPAPATARSTQSSMTLLGLLHFLWTQAGLHTWTPAMSGKRTLGVVHHYLLQAAANTYAGKIRIASNLLVSTPADAGRQADLNRAKAHEAMTRRRRLVVVAPLAQYQEGMESASTLPIAGFHGIPHLEITPELWDSTQRRFASELNAWMTGGRAVAVAQTDVPAPAKGAARARIVELGLMHVTADWIPVDSGYEAAVAAQLVADGRRFEKPLRFDSGNEATFPDFWLKDRASPIPLEVWGMADAEYLARKTEKVSHYDDKYGVGQWWQWDAAAGGEIPPFP